MFHAERCTQCGTCLEQCQWMDVDREQAARWQKEMMAGRHTPALDRCITCSACSEICPNGAEPFDLHAELQEKFRNLVPREMVDMTEAGYLFQGSLRDVPRAKRVLSACVLDKTEASLLQGRAYDLPRLGGKPYFCWGLFSHMGALSVQRSHAQAFVDNLAATDAEEVVCFHVDCYSMLAKVIPGFGIRVPFRPVHLAEHLVGFLKANSGLIRPLDLPIAYQRPCASRYTQEMEGAIDELFSLTGAERVKRTYDRERALCCTSVTLMYNRGDAAAEREKNVLDAREAGARLLVYFCPVCRNMLAGPAARHGLPLVFLGDLARMAIGEMPVPVA